MVFLFCYSAELLWLEFVVANIPHYIPNTVDISNTTQFDSCCQILIVDIWVLDLQDTILMVYGTIPGLAEIEVITMNITMN